MFFVLATEFPPGARIAIELTSPETSRSDPVATSKITSEGFGSLIFAIPQNWDSGEMITETNLFLTVNWAGGDESLTFKLARQDE